MSLIREAVSGPSVFKDEGPLSLEYLPPRLPHRDSQLKLLAQLFRFTLEKPGSSSERVLISGDIGTGKTVLAQRFGSDIGRVARERKIKLHYVHVNCRECRGSLFMMLKRVLAHFRREFPQRGLSAEELLDDLLTLLDREGAYLILALDEMESLIATDGSTALYSLTRVQESRMGSPLRMSLVGILRDLEALKKLDRSTIGTLQRNLILLERYSAEQLEAILKERVTLAFKEGTVPTETLKFIADLAAQTGDARYAIEVMWRSGKYADTSAAKEVTPEHVRKAVGSVYPDLQGKYVRDLSLHEKMLLLALARVLQSSGAAYATIGHVEKEYEVVCEEYGEEHKKHTQIWSYAQRLSAIGIATAKISGQGQRGKTTLLGLKLTPAEAMRKWVESSLETRKRVRRNY